MTSQATTAPTALDAPGALDRLVIRRRLGVAFVVVGTVTALAVAIGWPVLHRHYEGTQEQLDRYPGQITDVSRDGGDSDNGEVIVAYAGPRGPEATIAVHDVDDWYDDWIDSKRVTVLVDHGDPSFVTLPGENFLPGWFTGAIVAGIAFAVLFLGTGAALWLRSSRLLVRKSRSPWTKTVGSALIVGSGDSKSTYAYFPSFAPDVWWRVPNRVPNGSLEVEIAGDTSGAVFRLQGKSREFLATPKAFESDDFVALRKWQRRGSTIGFVIRTDVYVATDESLAAWMGEHRPPIVATLRTCKGRVAVMTVDDGSFAAFVRRLEPRYVRKFWSELLDRP